ncbi:MAG: type VI secretion system-associated protein TagF [Tabrizicola sp.]
MPDEVLTPDGDARPVAGFFGKLPATGDFVWRGLPDAFRKHWDAWLTRHIAPLQRAGHSFPEGHLRFRLPSGGRLAAGVILPSQDSAGRQFPLSLLLIANGDMSQAQIDPWCDAALQLSPEALSPDDLWQVLDALPAPTPQGSATGQMQIWASGHPPLTTRAEDPDNALRKLLPPV